MQQFTSVGPAGAAIGGGGGSTRAQQSARRALYGQSTERYCMYCALLPCAGRPCSGQPAAHARRGRRGRRAAAACVVRGPAPGHLRPPARGGGAELLFGAGCFSLWSCTAVRSYFHTVCWKTFLRRVLLLRAGKPALLRNAQSKWPPSTAPRFPSRGSLLRRSPAPQPTRPARPAQTEKL